MNRSARLVSLLVLMSALGCAVLPDDPDVGARELMSRGELLEALLVLERIGPDDPAHAEARGLAAAVEERIQVAEDCVQRGLAQRAERQDEQAAQSFSEALLAWPRCDVAHALLRSTRARVAGAGLSPVRAAPPADEAAVAERSPAPADPIETEVPLDRPDTASRPAATYLEQDSQQDPGGPGGGAQHARRLKSARTLSQRALVRYGRGELEEAIATWQSVLRILPDDPVTLEYLRTARKELGETGGNAKEASPIR